jgi:steroid 5-alpha reductase family enzyme
LNHHHHHPNCIRICMRALSWLALVVWYTGIIVKRFQSLLSLFLFYYSLSLITCVHHIVTRTKKTRFRTIIDLLLSLFSLRVAWHNTRPIKWNKSSEASKENEERERERENLHTSNAHLYWIYILRCMWVFGVRTHNVRITFCTF